MSKIPIEVIKYINENQYHGDAVRFQVIIREKGQSWDRCFECGFDDLVRFQNEISEIIDSISWHQKLGIDPSLAGRIDAVNGSDEICSGCSFKKSRNCVTCLTVLQSPLERKLYPKLLESNMYFEVQVPIDKFGKKAKTNNGAETDLRLKYAAFYLTRQAQAVVVAGFNKRQKKSLAGASGGYTIAERGQRLLFYYCKYN